MFSRFPLDFLKLDLEEFWQSPIEYVNFSVLDMLFKIITIFAIIIGIWYCAYFIIYFNAINRFHSIKYKSIPQLIDSRDFFQLRITVGHKQWLWCTYVHIECCVLMGYLSDLHEQHIHAVKKSTRQHLMESITQ